jgi:hypothetical protein
MFACSGFSFDVGAASAFQYLSIIDVNWIILRGRNMNTKNNNKREMMIVNGEEFSRADFERAFANKRNRMSLWVRVGVAFLLGVCLFLLLCFNQLLA